MSQEPAKKSQEQSIYDADSYHEVTFNHKASEVEPDEIQLSVNGDTLQYMRGVRVIVPGPFLEAADHATYSKTVKKIGEQRMTAAPISRCSYQYHGKSDKAKFLAARNAGKKKVKDYWQNKGDNTEEDGE
jgi:hypothetical protein